MGGSATSLSYGFGCGKAVLLIDDLAYGFYFTEKGYLGSKHNYELNYHLFNYPCITGISFMDKQHCIQMQRVNGIVYDDETHDRIVVQKLLECAVSAVSKVNQDNVLYLQHGDANRVNIIWVNQSEFVFIDLDNISYYPPLLDVFHYLCNAKYSLDEIVDLLYSHQALLEQICIKIGIQSNANPLDTLFLGYVEHYLKNVRGCYEDFQFLNCKNTHSYPKTNKLLCEWSGTIQ